VSIALTSPERRRLTTTTVLFLLLYLVLAPETLRTPVERRSVTHIQRERSGRFVCLILFGLFRLTYRGITVAGGSRRLPARDGERNEVKMSKKKRKKKVTYSLRFRAWLFMIGIGLESKLAWKGGGAW
jgi:hypothetical protein